MKGIRIVSFIAICMLISQIALAAGPDPIHYFRLENASGEDSAGNLTLAALGNPTPVEGAFGDANGAAYFDGSSILCREDGGAGTNFTTPEQGTLEAFFKPDSPFADSYTISGRMGGNRTYLLHGRGGPHNEGNQLQFEVGDQFDEVVLFHVDDAVEHLFYYAVTWDTTSGDYEAFLADITAGEKQLAKLSGNWAQIRDTGRVQDGAFGIGCLAMDFAAADDCYFIGMVDEVAVYESRLSEGQLQGHLDGFYSGRSYFGIAKPAGKLSTTWGSLKAAY